MYASLETCANLIFYMNFNLLDKFLKQKNCKETWQVLIFFAKVQKLVALRLTTDSSRTGSDE